MGESVVEAPSTENKMGEPVVSRATLEVSVSFGRFENDSLSWEKWSSFSPNKYLEEVEKFSTPGSVAQKKAYFEAHYKKIAARKAELLDQENPMETDPSISDDLNCEELNGNTSGIDTEIIMCKDQSSAEEVEQETNSKDSAMAALECASSLVEEAIEELNGKPESCEFHDPEEADLVKEEPLLKGSQDPVKVQPQKVDNERGNTHEIKEENAKLDVPSISQKITPIKKERNLAGTKKKKPVSPMPKPPQTSSPRFSKPTTTSTVMSASWTSTKTANVSSLQRSKNPSVGESKRGAPTSLHMSLSLGPRNSDSASLPTTRKSLIMEQMGDKDIVKRAFKTFQNNLNQLRSSSGENYCGPTQVSTRGSEQKVFACMTPRKDHERIRTAAEKMNAQRGQSGTRWSSMSLGSPKAAGMDGRNMKVASSSIGLRSDERAKRPKEFCKKLEDKSYDKEAEKTRLSSKSKEKKEAEIKKLRQSLNFKAKPMPGFYRGQGILKNSSKKEGAKTEIHG